MPHHLIQQRRLDRVDQLLVQVGRVRRSRVAAPLADPLGDQRPQAFGDRGRAGGGGRVRGNVRVAADRRGPRSPRAPGRCAARGRCPATAATSGTRACPPATPRPGSRRRTRSRKCSARSGDVVHAVAQRRQVDRVDVEAEEQVVAEPAVADRGATGRRAWPRRSAHRPAAARSPPTGMHLLPLQHAQQLRLHRQRDVGRVRRGTRCRRRPARADPSRGLSAPVNAPFTWPKSSLSTRFGFSAATWTRQERLAAPRAVGVNRAGDQFLAGAALAGDEHACRRSARPGRCA